MKASSRDVVLCTLSYHISFRVLGDMFDSAIQPLCLILAPRGVKFTTSLKYNYVLDEMLTQGSSRTFTWLFFQRNFSRGCSRMSIGRTSSLILRVIIIVGTVLRYYLEYKRPACILFFTG